MRRLLASTPLGVTTLTTPGGMSVCWSMIRANARPASGVSGDGLRTTVLPAASALDTFITFRLCGKFHGVSTETTPRGSWRSSVVPAAPYASIGSSVNCAASSPACSAMNAGPSTWISRSLVVAPHSTWDRAKKSSACSSSALPSWSDSGRDRRVWPWPTGLCRRPLARPRSRRRRRRGRRRGPGRSFPRWPARCRRSARRVARPTARRCTASSRQPVEAGPP